MTQRVCRQDKYLIDVREPDEVLQGSIPSSVNLPLSTLPNSLHLDPATFKQRFGFTKPRPNQEITFYCRSGKRSASACDIAKRNGYTKYVVLPPFHRTKLIRCAASTTTKAPGSIGRRERVLSPHHRERVYGRTMCIIEQPLAQVLVHVRYGCSAYLLLVCEYLAQAAAVRPRTLGHQSLVVGMSLSDER